MSRFVVIFLLVFYSNLYSETFEQALIQNHFDVSMKSSKGWIRVLNNKDKLKIYGLDGYTKKEIISFINELSAKNQDVGGLR